MSNEVVNLSKGGVVNLSKRAPGLQQVTVGLGWDPADKETTSNEAPKKGFFKRLFGSGSDTSRPSRAETIDCDAFAVLLQDGKLASDSDIVYFGRQKHYTESVLHCGDNLTGEGEGDDENIIIKLDKVPDKYDKIIIAVNIYMAYEKHQTFGGIKNSFIRLVNMDTNREICRYDISNMAEYDDKTAVVFGQLEKTAGEWEFKALGYGYKVRSISELAEQYR